MTDRDEDGHLATGLDETNTPHRANWTGQESSMNEPLTPLEQIAKVDLDEVDEQAEEA
jgi:hypothetical protein